MYKTNFNKGPFIIYAGGWAGKNRGEGVTPISGQSEGGHDEIGVQEGGLSDFTILFYFKEICSLLSAVLNGTS